MRPIVTRGLAKIPVLMDDHPLHTGADDFNSWWDKLQSLVRTQSFVTCGLHDCYADRWLEHYPEMLATLKGAGVLRGLDEVAGLVWRTTGV